MVRPITGFAEMPEKPSEPPHSTPITSSDSGTGCRLISFACCRDIRVWRIMASSMSTGSLQDWRS